MGFDWTGKADAPPRADIMNEGYHRAKVIRVYTAKSDGTPFVSKQNDRQVMIVLTNEAGDEALTRFTLNDKAGGILAHFLKCAGANLQRMKDDGIELDSFADQKFAEKQLTNRELWIRVTHSAGGNGKTYANVEALDEADVPPDVLQAAKGGKRDVAKELAPVTPDGAAADDDDLPF